jgi:hypothetical protein
MASVSEDEVLLLWRSLLSFRTERRPACAPRGPSRKSRCPLFDACPRWHDGDDWAMTLDEDTEATEQRHATWPCSRLLDLLGPETRRIE